MKIITCACCGAELTMPQYHNGKPYGYSCIRKIVPSFKRKKVVFVRLEVLADRTPNTENKARKELIVTDGVTKGFVVSYNDIEKGAEVPVAVDMAESEWDGIVAGRVRGRNKARPIFGGDL